MESSNEVQVLIVGGRSMPSYVAIEMHVQGIESINYFNSAEYIVEQTSSKLQIN